MRAKLDVSSKTCGPIKCLLLALGISHISAGRGQHTGKCWVGPRVLLAGPEEESERLDVPLTVKPSPRIVVTFSWGWSIRKVAL